MASILEPFCLYAFICGFLGLPLMKSSKFFTVRDTRYKLFKKNCIWTASFFDFAKLCLNFIAVKKAGQILKISRLENELELKKILPVSQILPNFIGGKPRKFTVKFVLYSRWRHKLEKRSRYPVELAWTIVTFALSVPPTTKYTNFDKESMGSLVLLLFTTRNLHLLRANISFKIAVVFESQYLLQDCTQRVSQRQSSFTDTCEPGLIQTLCIDF